MYIENSPLYKVLKPTSVEAAHKELLAQLMKYAAMDRTTLIDYLISFSGTWDNYALSVMYMEVDPDIFHYNAETCGFLSEWNDLLEQNVSADPTKRNMPADTLTIFDDIFLCSTAFSSGSRSDEDR